MTYKAYRLYALTAGLAALLSFARPISDSRASCTTSDILPNIGSYRIVSCSYDENDDGFPEHRERRVYWGETLVKREVRETKGHETIITLFAYKKGGELAKTSERTIRQLDLQSSSVAKVYDISGKTLSMKLDYDNNGNVDEVIEHTPLGETHLMKNKEGKLVALAELVDKGQ